MHGGRNQSELIIDSDAYWSLQVGILAKSEIGHLVWPFIHCGARKLVFGVFDQVKLKPACAAKEDW